MVLRQATTPVGFGPQRHERSQFQEESNSRSDKLWRSGLFRCIARYPSNTNRRCSRHFSWPPDIIPRYGKWVLTHPNEGKASSCSSRARRYGPDVQQALVTVWNAANRICSKRLIPFLPTLVEALERHGQIQLTPACRDQLLAISAATADRLLRPVRAQRVRGISTTRAGTVLQK